MFSTVWFAQTLRSEASNIVILTEASNASAVSVILTEASNASAVEGSRTASRQRSRFRFSIAVSNIVTLTEFRTARTA